MLSGIIIQNANYSTKTDSIDWTNCSIIMNIYLCVCLCEGICICVRMFTYEEKWIYNTRNINKLMKQNILSSSPTPDQFYTLLLMCSGDWYVRKDTKLFFIEGHIVQAGCNRVRWAGDIDYILMGCCLRSSPSIISKFHYTYTLSCSENVFLYDWK